MIKTKNFNPDTDPKLLCTCGHPDCDKRSVDQKTLKQVQLVRDDLGEGMIIMSGGRCLNHPDEVAKTARGIIGDHPLCVAVDVRCNSKSLETKLKVLAGRHGATRVAGSAKAGFIHMAWTETNRRDVPTWSYS